MSDSLVENDPPVPNGPRGQAFIESAAAGIRFDTLALAVIDRAAPRPEGFLAVHGVDALAMLRWCEQGHAADELWRQAIDTGCVCGAGAIGRLVSAPSVLMHTLPASLDHRRVWLLALGRSGGFNDYDRLQAALLPKLKQLEFDGCGEPGMGRLLLDGRDNLLHADPTTEARFRAAPDHFGQFVQTLRGVVCQRWPDGPGWRPHDAILPLDGGATWVRFNRCTPAQGVPPHLYVELRPAGPEDPPPVGVVSDARIARALAYLSDEYRAGPSLRQAADAVGLSPFHFHRLFSREVGTSPKHYLLRTQMMVAKWLLATTREPVNQVASAAGFTSHGHFTATFHRLVGVSPSDYRSGGRGSGRSPINDTEVGG